jgi:hypothetical protein
MGVKIMAQPDLKIVEDEKPVEKVNLGWGRRKQPEITKNFDPEKSIKNVRAAYHNWKNLTDEILNELYIARAILSKSPSEAAKYMHGTTVPSMTWTDYCEALGFSRQTVNRWLKRAFGDDSKFEPKKIARKYVTSINNVSGKTNLYVVPWNGNVDKLLEKTWKGRVFVSVEHNIKLSAIEKLMEEYNAGNITDAFVHINRPDTSSELFQSLCEGALCFVDHKLQYEGDKNAKNSACFIYLGKNQKQFIKEFKNHGSVFVKA